MQSSADSTGLLRVTGTPTYAVLKYVTLTESKLPCQRRHSEEYSATG